MALIDEIGNEKKQKENKDDYKCSVCSIFSHNVNVELKICESCFNKELTEALKKIDQNIYEINQEIIKVHHFKNQLDNVLNDSEVHLIVKNKAEIDLINVESALLKFQIDLNANKKAYVLNQEQANKFRKQNNWELYDINNKYE